MTGSGAVAGSSARVPGVLSRAVLSGPSEFDAPCMLDAVYPTPSPGAIGQGKANRFAALRHCVGRRDGATSPAFADCCGECRSFERAPIFEYACAVSASDRDIPEGSSRESKTPLSSSGVVAKDTGGVTDVPVASVRKQGGYSAYRLTPYQARLDVEMDDTAVSKVRDPSVSLILEPSATLRPRKPSATGLEALTSIAIGAALGALLVGIVVVIARAL